MKKIIFSAVLFLFVLHAMPLRADSWRIYKTSASYLNGTFTGDVKLPAGHRTVDAFLLAGGTAFCKTDGGEPFIIEGSGTITAEQASSYRLGVKAIEGVARTSGGETYIYTHATIGYYDPAARAWFGFDCRTGEGDGKLPALECIYIENVTFDRNDRMVVTGLVSETEPFVAVLENGGWKFFAVDTELTTDGQFVQKGTLPKPCFLRSGVAGKDGSVWFLQEFNQKQRLLRFMDGKITVGAEEDPSKHEFVSIQTDYHGNILYTTAKHTGLFDPVTKEFRVLTDSGLKTFAVDASALWYAVNIRTTVGIAEGPTTLLRRLDLSTGKTNDYTTANCPIDSPIGVIRADAAGNLVIVSDGEVIMLDRIDLSEYAGRWSYVSSGYMDPVDYARIDWIAENNTGAAPVSVSWLQHDPILRWVGRYSAGAWEYHGMTVDAEAPLGFGLKGTRPVSVANTSKGIIVGTANDGPMIYDVEKQHAAHIPGYDKKSLGDDVSSIAEDANGILWFGTNKGLVRYDGTAPTLLNAKNSDFKGKKVTCLHVAPDNTLWVGSAGEGLFSFDGTSWKNYAKKEVFKHGNIGSVSGTVFVSEYSTFGESKSLYVFENGTFSVEELPVQLRRGSDLITDPGNNLWIISGRAVICRKPDGTQVVYDRSNSPVGYDGSSIATAYSMTGFYCDGKLYLKTGHKQMTDPKAVYSGNETIKALCEKYKDRVNTFTDEAIYILDTNK